MIVANYCKIRKTLANVRTNDRKSGFSMIKKVTRLEDIARQAGVSVSTASRALNDSPAVNRRTKEAIWKLARQHDYPFRGSMPAGPIGAKATVSLVVPRPQGRDPKLSDPFFFELLSGLGDAARARDCDIHISHVRPTDFDGLHAAMTTHRAEGVVFVGQANLHTAYNKLTETDGRFVVWGADLPEQAYCSIGSDNELGGRKTTNHLIRLGRKRIAFLGRTDAPEIAQRFRGYQEALSEAGISADPSLYAPAYFTIESAQGCVDAMLSEGHEFDAIIAASDVIALGAVRALRRRGISVPDDVSVVGYDNIEFAAYGTPTLTTIEQNMEVAGRLLLSKLLDRSGRGAAESERLSTDLIVRESCGG
jgi:DNA-binding LacI/PurR family transcriptional regulator